MPRRTLRTAINLTTLTALVAAPLAVGFTAPASASVSTAISSFPYTQDWSGLTATSTWADFPGVEGFNTGTSIAPQNPSNATDVGTLTAEGTLASSFLVQSNTSVPNTASAGGVLAFANVPTASKTVALSATGSQTAPLLAFHLNTTGKSGFAVAYDVQDLDSSADDQPQRVALQYRVGTSGAYTNVPAAYLTDATGPSNATVTTTRVSATLPAAVDNQADVYLRVITIDNATGSNEHVGIDNIDITAGGAPAPLGATDPGDRSVFVNRALTPFTLQVTGGVAPFSWSATGTPDGVSVASDGTVSGTPTETGTFTVEATVTDNASATASTQFDIVVSEIPVKPFHPITEIQGEGDASPYAVAGSAADVSTEGVVTARYPDGGLNGFVIQTPGYDPTDDATPNASDGLFVYQGSSPSYAPPAIGDHVTIANGRVTEFFGLTQITVTDGAFVESRPATAEEAVVPGSVLPGTDCSLTGTAGSVTTDCLTGAELSAEREKHESEIFRPTAPFTVSDSYDGSPWGAPFNSNSSNNFGEIGLAAGETTPLLIPVDEANPATERAAYDARVDHNYAKRITLDDGATVSISGTNNTNVAYPWLTKTHSVRVGAAVTFPQPVVFDYRNSVWKIYPQTRVQPGTTGSDRVAIEQDRAEHATPEAVGGNVKIATFNMLNYFVHAAQDWDNLPDDATGTNRSCTYYTDRQGNRITARDCTWRDLRNNPPSTLPDIGPRGAATEANLLRQEGKEVAAINTMAADVMSLEEVENPVKLGYVDRDLPLARLVAALNADWQARHPGEDVAADPRWAYVPSPRPEAQPTIAEQDAIRNAFIYNPRVIETIGRSQILLNSPAMRNAREPLAQAFRHVDGTREDGFVVIVNHFKSKSAPDDESTVAGTDNADAGFGAGFYNGDRIRQARALAEFADAVSSDKGIAPVFMTGDYNAYGAEDPVRTLEAAGFTNLKPADGTTSYSFGGLAGSLDHVFANEAALDMVTGETIWQINANEPIYYEYSRYNYNVADLFDGTTPFRSSDHNPEIVGIDAPTSTAPEAVDTVQVLASNDFHGRLLDDPASASAGAAAMAGAVKGLRTDNPNTAFVMAGDIVGASTFESFIQNDKPTIDAMNEAGLEVSAAGNHEFDQGYDDLMDRIMSATHPEGGADWPYIAANVRDEATGDYALKSDRTDGNFEHANGATWWKEFPTLGGGNGIKVGFVGAVTEDLDSLVAPSAIDGLEITSIVDEVNDAAADLKAAGCGGEPCDLVIELVHEGAPSPSCDTIRNDQDSTFGRIVHEASTDVDAIISGHTHLKYNCKVTVAGKTIERPVVSAGQYGAYLNQLEFDFTPGTNDLVGIRQHVLSMKDYDEDADTEAIVDAAVAVADVEGAVELGQVAAPFKRARRVDPQSGVVENRGGESTLGNLVAEMQRWKTGADIGVMNPGGLRDDLVGTDNGPGPVTKREAANVQPFANTLVTVDLTGAQLKTLLEQQWQRDPDGNIPSRPFLRLGTSKGFTWTEDSSRAEGQRITGMWLNGVAISPTGTYTVSANSFIATGGDNFRALTLGADRQDTGFTDLQATIDYLDEFANAGEGDAPLAVDYQQHGVGAKVPAGPFSAGQTVMVPLDSLSMTGGGTSADITDLTDTSVTVTHGTTDLGTFPVTSALPTTAFDTPGAATVSFPLPAGLSGGTQWFTVTGAATGTVAKIPVEVVDTRAVSTVSGTAADIIWGQAGSVEVTVTPSGATGTVELYDGTTKIGEGTLAGDATTIAVPAESLAVGTHTLTLKYLGDVAHQPAQGSVSVTVKATGAVAATPTPASVVQDSGTSTIAVAVTATGTTPTGTVSAWLGGTQLASATLANGQASLVVGPFATVGEKSIEVRYSGSDTVTAASRTVTVTVTAKPTPQPTPTTVTGTDTAIQWAKAGSVAVTVAPASATGTVELYEGTARLGTATLSGGAASFPLAARSLEVGTHTMVVRYLGSATHAASQDTLTVTVTKAKPKVQVEKPRKVEAGDKAKIKVEVSAPGYEPTGMVRIVLKGAGKGMGRSISVVKDLDGGEVVARVRVAKSGTYDVTVTYLGDEHTLRGEDSTRLRVK
ncbi:ExeM/NucH family extracellular endonuclease [Nocardioides sp.]|uniref:ExeM/NucH family extracellular endonuclease n=1 Tax=Nocardioides sp. TaxID=35761 RepID=UPI0035B1EBE8